MWLEQEMASIVKFVLGAAGNPSPYYWDVPAHFSVPAIYFPIPEIETNGETFRTYGMDYSWFIKIFHATKEAAYSIALLVITEIRAARNRIPLIAEDGGEIPGGGIRLRDPEFKIPDDGVAQVTIRWRSRRPYREAGAQRTQTFGVDVFVKQGNIISDAYAEALEKYALPLDQGSRKPE